jgi:hypothetical protein
MAVIRKKSEGDCTFKAGLKRKSTWACQPCRVSGLLEQPVGADKTCGRLSISSGA